MRRGEIDYNPYGEVDALKANGSFFPHYNKNGHVQIPSANGTTNSISEEEPYFWQFVPRVWGKPYLAKIVDFFGEVTPPMQEEMHPLNRYKRPETVLTVYSPELHPIPGIDSIKEQEGGAIRVGREKRQLIKVRLQIQQELEKAVPLVVGTHPSENGHISHPNGNGHTNGHEAEVKVPVQKA